MTLPEIEAALKELRQKQGSFERTLADNRHDQLRAEVDDWFLRMLPIVEANTRAIDELRLLVESYIRSIHIR